MLNDKLLAGPDLLHGLVGTTFRFHEAPIADIESMFLQVLIPEQDRGCLMFLWRPRTEEPVQIYVYQRHVFGTVLQLVQTALSSEWDWKTKESIRLQQRQCMATSA